MVTHVPKYTKNQYSDGFSICGLIIGAIFVYAGISDLFGHGWFGWVWWLGFIWLGIGGSIIFGNFMALYNRDRLKNLVQTEVTRSKTTSVHAIAKATGITEKDVRHILMDLKLEGKLFAHYDKDTGEIKGVHAPVQGHGGTEVARPVAFPHPSPAPLPEVKSASGKTRRYCPFCGNLASESAKFCSMCGSELHQ